MLTRLQRACCAVAVCAIASCGPGVALRGVPEPVERLAPARALGEYGSIVALPRIGEARAAQLADGWPVWVIRHRDGGITVVSAVVERARSARTLFAGGTTLARWAPLRRRIVAGDVAYDERGHADSYVSPFDCGYECPGDVAPANGERDLDRFDAAVDVISGRVVIGRRVPAPPAPASFWVDYDQPPHAASELDLDPEIAWPLEPERLADAIDKPIGSYSIVIGSLVQSTDELPRICASAGAGDACDRRSPLALGLPKIPINRDATHVESGMILVRRELAGLRVIATSALGGCSGVACGLLGDRARQIGELGRESRVETRTRGRVELRRRAHELARRRERRRQIARGDVHGRQVAARHHHGVAELVRHLRRIVGRHHRARVVGGALARDSRQRC